MVVVHQVVQREVVAANGRHELGNQCCLALEAVHVVGVLLAVEELDNLICVDRPSKALADGLYTMLAALANPVQASLTQQPAPESLAPVPHRRTAAPQERRMKSHLECATDKRCLGGRERAVDAGGQLVDGENAAVARVQESEERDDVLLINATHLLQSIDELDRACTPPRLVCEHLVGVV